MGFIKGVGKFFGDIFLTVLKKVIVFGILILLVIFLVKYFLGINILNFFGM